MAGSRVKGWCRIGIVLSVVSFVGFGGYLWSDAARNALDFYGGQLKTCYQILNIDNDALQYVQPEDREKKQSATWAKFENCKKGASTFFSQQADDNYKAIPILLGIDLATVALGWLVVWLGVLIVRRIRHGFVPT